MMDRKKVLAAPVPYIEAFGVDGLGRGRPTVDSVAASVLPVLDLPDIPDMDLAMKIRGQARVRAMTVLKAMYAREFKAIYNKEVRHLVEMAAMESKQGVGEARVDKSASKERVAKASG